MVFSRPAKAFCSRNGAVLSTGGVLRVVAAAGAVDVVFCFGCFGCFGCFVSCFVLLFVLPESGMPVCTVVMCR